MLQKYCKIKKREKGEACLKRLNRENLLVASVFPPRCPVCGELRIPWESGTCTECIGKLHRIQEPVCMCCGRELTDEQQEYCVQCRLHPMSFQRNFAVWEYDKWMKKSIADFKYNGRKEYAEFYIRHMVQLFGTYLLRYGIEAFVPVPISDKRRRGRGYNQAELLADGLAKRMGIPSVRLLNRGRDTLPQNGLSPEERKRNLKDSFLWNEAEAKNMTRLPQTVALVDDIFTTGTTMELCTKVLQANGILSVYGICISIGMG